MVTVLRATYAVVACACTAIACLLLLMPARFVPAASLPGQDKLEHLALFALLAFLWRAAGAPTWAACVTVAVLTVGSELAQGAMHWGRSCDPRDALADVLGAGLGLIAWRLAARNRRAEPP